MTQLTCTEREMTFAVGAADVLDPARVGAALEALSTAMVSNLHGRIESTQSAQVAGMTPQPSARHVRIVGRRPDGAVAMVELTVFAFGTRVYQAALLGERLDPDLTRTFFASLRVTP
ncbi:MAG: hypothetical protein HY021_00005 [Burkholderiales bacterium]|nr:hypothetical protein [Burkholderiales bacterium]